MRLHTLIASSAIVMGIASAASADTVDMQFVANGRGWRPTVTVNGFSVTNVFAGERLHLFSNGTGAAAQLDGRTIATFSTDIFQDVARSGAVFDLINAADVPMAADGASRAAIIENLFRYRANIDHDAFETESRARDFAAAFQLAIWEIVYEPQFSFDNALGSMSLTSGLMTATRSDGTQLGWWVRKYFDQIARASSNLHQGNGLTIGLTNDYYMNQVATVFIPLPSTAALGVAGLSIASLRRRR